MKLNHDCVRGVLLAIEDSSSTHARITVDKLVGNQYLKEFSSKDIHYTIARLNEAGYINVHTIKIAGIGEDFIVESLTWNGHAFLDNIRDNTIWDKTKKSVSVLSSVSLSILSEVAKEAVKKAVGL
jgi:hypothetical protein